MFLRMVRGSYGHGSPSTVMSQAKRARFGCQGTGVKLARSGIAAMSGSAGVWPISPAAKPAKPAPFSTKSSRFQAGISFALGRACMSTNCAKKNSIPSSSERVRISSSVGVVPIQQPPASGCTGTIASRPAREDGSFLQARGAGCVRSGGPERVLQLHELHGDLDHQPVVPAQVDARDL